MTRTVLRKPAVLAATGWSNSTLYEKIARGIFPKPTKLDPDGRAVVWFEDEVAEFQKRAISRHSRPALRAELSRAARPLLSRRDEASEIAPAGKARA
jgi:predicted DNA-binding transcriptional regulator AlpA